MTKAKIAPVLAMFVLLVGLAGAAIGPTGGTEDFEGMTLADEAVITTELPTDWGTRNVDTGNPYFYDTSKSGGTLDTAGWTVAGGLSKPASTADIRMYPTVIGTAWRWIEGPAITNAPNSTYTFWVGLSAGSIEQDMVFRVTYDVGGTNTFIRVNFTKSTSPQKVRFRTRGIVTLDGATVYDDDGLTDVNLNEWNKVEISVVSSTTAEGSFSMKWNEVEKWTGVIPVDASGILSSHQFACYAHTDVVSGNAYVDDVSVILGTAVNDWMMFD